MLGLKSAILFFVFCFIFPLKKHIWKLSKLSPWIPLKHRIKNVVFQLSSLRSSLLPMALIWLRSLRLLKKSYFSFPMLILHGKEGTVIFSLLYYPGIYWVGIQLKLRQRNPTFLSHDIYFHLYPCRLWTICRQDLNDIHLSVLPALLDASYMLMPCLLILSPKGINFLKKTKILSFEIIPNLEKSWKNYAKNFQIPFAQIQQLLKILPH